VVTWPSEQIAVITSMRLPILQLSCRFFGKASHHPGLSAPLQPRFRSLLLLVFPKARKIAFERKEICECDGHTIYKHSQRRLTADWLAPRERDCSRIHSKVSSDWLPTYITTGSRDIQNDWILSGQPSCTQLPVCRRVQMKRYDNKAARDILELTCCMPE